MKKSFYISLIIVIILFSCKEKDPSASIIGEAESNTAIEKKTITSGKSDIKKTQSLKDQIKNVEYDCLDFDDLLSEFENKDYSDEIINQNASEKWISELEQKDSLQFERADLLALKCKIFENDKILSVAFVDLFDYKTALHLITFQKPDLKPASSFIFFLYGGDGEDFWSISSKRTDPLRFEIQEEFGYDNSVYKKDELLIELREKKEYLIDSITGKLTKRILSLKTNFKEIRK